MTQTSHENPTVPTESAAADCHELGTCSDSRIQKIYEYLDGALTHEDIEEVRDHLEGCEHCNNEYDLECIIRSVVKRSCQEKAPDTLKGRIMDRITELQTQAGH